MPKQQRDKKAAAPLRKAAPQRRSRPVVELGVLNERLGYFIRRVQVWIFQDFIRRLAATIAHHAITAGS